MKFNGEKQNENIKLLHYKNITKNSVKAKHDQHKFYYITVILFNL